MKVDRIELFHVAIPLPKRFYPQEGAVHRAAPGPQAAAVKRKAEEANGE
jgi:hypothetical protein